MTSSKLLTNASGKLFTYARLGARRFVWVCGSFEAAAMDGKLSRGPTRFPLTYDALAATVAALGGQVVDVVVHEIRDRTYNYSEVRIDHGGRLLRLEASPADAVTLAVTCGVPIFVRESLLGR